MRSQLSAYTAEGCGYEADGLSGFGWGSVGSGETVEQRFGRRDECGVRVEHDRRHCGCFRDADKREQAGEMYPRTVTGVGHRAAVVRLRAVMHRTRITIFRS